jgi:cobalt-zinc-cadmium efflux system protein
VAPGHDHDGSEHGSPQHGGRLAVAFAITVAVLLAQVVGAVWTGSLALLMDAAHGLTDAAALLMALVAASLATRPTTSRRTWGLRRAEVLAATAQAIGLLAVGGYVLVEGLQRLGDPPDVPARGLLVFGLVGLAGNLASVAVLASRRTANLNLRAAFLEVVADALGSLAVVVAAIVLATTGWRPVDTVAAVAVGALVLPRAARLLREAVDILLESAPRDIDLAEVRAHLLEVDHVRDVHDLHVTQIATDLPVLTAHVVIDDGCFHDGHAPALLGELQRCVAEHFPISIEHSTFQLEPASHDERTTHD